MKLSKVLNNKKSFKQYLNMLEAEKTIEVDSKNRIQLNESELSEFESRLIFGDLLENINDILLMENSRVSIGNLNQANKNVLSALKSGNANIINKTRQIANDAHANLVKQNIEDNQKKDVLSGEKIKEDVEVVSTSLDGKEKVVKEVNKENQEAINESVEVKKNSYSAMLFNGESGNYLKYMLNNEINNNNKESLYILKNLEGNEEVKVIIKKIKFLLKKGEKRELTPEQYTELKVLKNKFKIAFTKAKNEYKNKYKN